MVPRVLIFALSLMTCTMWLPPEAATVRSWQGQSLWSRTESQHFEIHYLSGLAPEADAWFEAPSGHTHQGRIMAANQSERNDTYPAAGDNEVSRLRAEVGVLRTESLSVEWNPHLAKRWNRSHSSVQRGPICRMLEECI
jgi:hypothetical protein